MEEQIPHQEIYTEEPSEVSSPPSRKSSKKIFLLGLLFAIILAGVGISAFFMGADKSNKTFPVDTPFETKVTPTPQPKTSTKTPTPTPKEVAITIPDEWNTYEKESYSFRFPQNWSLFDGHGARFLAPNQNTNYWMVEPTFYYENDMTLEELAEGTLTPDQKLISKKNITVDGQKAIRIDQEAKTSDYYNYSISVFIEDEQVTSFINDDGTVNERVVDGYLALYMYIQDESQKAEMIQTFDQILSSLKFIQ